MTSATVHTPGARGARCWVLWRALPVDRGRPRRENELIRFRVRLIALLLAVCAHAAPALAEDSAGSNPSKPQPAKVDVTVAVSGPGVVIDGEGHACSSGSCTFAETSGASVTLTAHPDGGARFVGWGGACGGSGSCPITVGPSTSVSATFSGLPSGGGFGGSRRVRITRVGVHGDRVSVRISAPIGTHLRCALTPHSPAGWARDRFYRCGTFETFTGVSRGRYRLRVRSRHRGSATRYVLVS
jgi:hypothetical protein